MEKKVGSKYAKKYHCLTFLFQQLWYINITTYLLGLTSVIVVCWKSIFFQIPSLFNFFRAE